MILFLAPFIHSCLTSNLLPLDLGSSWLGSSDLVSDGAVWGVGGEMGTGGFLCEPHTGKQCPPKGYDWLGKGGSEGFINVTPTPESPLATSSAGCCF